MFSFKTFLESNSVKWYHFAHISCSAYGHHGYGDRSEMPADDPRQISVEWSLTLDDPVVIEKNTQILAGSPIMVIENPETGSYHERFLGIFVFIQITTEQIYKLEDENADVWHGWNGQVYNGNTSQRPMKGYKVVGQFPFTSLEDATQRIVEMCRVKPPLNMPHIIPVPQVNLPHTNLSSDAWWKDQVNRTIPVNNKRKDLDGE